MIIVYEMVFQITPWDVYEKIYTSNNINTRLNFIKKIKKDNINNRDKYNFFPEVYNEIDSQIKIMQNDFLSFGYARIDPLTFLEINQYDFSTYTESKKIIN